MNGTTLKTYFKADKWLLTALVFCILTQAALFLWHDPIIHGICLVEVDSKVASLFAKMGFKAADLCELRGKLWIVSALFILLSFVFFLRGFLRHLSDIRKFKLRDLQIRTRLFTFFNGPQKDVLFLALHLLVLFYIVYLTAGFAWRHTLTEGKLGAFGADEKDPFYWTQFSRDPDFAYHHKAVHPLLLLIEVPLGSLLHVAGLPEDVAALLINSFFGALSVGMSFLCFFLITRSRFYSVLGAVFYGFTMSQMVFGTVPEVYSLGACSIILSYLLLFICQSKGRLYFGLWVLAGILSFGISTVNFSHTVFAFMAALVECRKSERIMTVFELVGTVVFCVFLLSWVQKWIFPSAYFFFSPDDILKNTQFWKAHLSLKEPGFFLSECFKVFFLISFSAPLPHHMLTRGGELSFFMSALKYSLPGALGTAVWICILANGVIRNFVRGKPVFWFILAAVLLNALFYMHYNGPEAFLYSPHVVFSVILLAIFGAPMAGRLFGIVLVAAIILTGINNVLVMDKVIFLKEGIPIAKELSYVCHKQSALFR